MIYHIALKEEWEESEGQYCPLTFYHDGFIHCSAKEKIEESANKFFKGLKNLLVLSIDENKVTAEIKWKDLYGSKNIFPHIYGKLNIDSVIYIKEIKSDKYGEFKL